MEERFLAVSPAVGDWRFIVKRIAWPEAPHPAVLHRKSFKERRTP